MKARARVRWNCLRKTRGDGGGGGGGCGAKERIQMVSSFIQFLDCTKSCFCQCPRLRTLLEGRLHGCAVYLWLRYATDVEKHVGGTFTTWILPGVASTIVNGECPLRMGAKVCSALNVCISLTSWNKEGRFSWALLLALLSRFFLTLRVGS